MSSIPYDPPTSREETGFTPTFAPVPVRERHDGWTPARQADFIAALAESGCVADACARVGQSRESAYRLRARHDATDFRSAWALAIDFAVDRLEHAVLARAIDGVAVPHYFQGELVGEHRRYDERLALFLLRYRRPAVYGRHLDAVPPPREHPERRAESVAIGLAAVRCDASRALYEREALERRETAARDRAGAAESYAASAGPDAGELADRRARAAAAAAERDRYARTMIAAGGDVPAPAGAMPVGRELPPFMVSPSSTSAPGASGAGASGTGAGNRLGRRAARRQAARAAGRRPGPAGVRTQPPGESG